VRSPSDGTDCLHADRTGANAPDAVHEFKVGPIQQSRSSKTVTCSLSAPVMCCSPRFRDKKGGQVVAGFIDGIQAEYKMSDRVNVFWHIRTHAMVAVARFYRDSLKARI
jgi:hypothetical protein